METPVVASKTDRGRVREENQDAILADLPLDLIGGRMLHHLAASIGAHHDHRLVVSVDSQTIEDIDPVFVAPQVQVAEQDIGKLT
jgi:hypothetical protein